MFKILKTDLMDNYHLTDASLFKLFSLNIKTIYSTTATKLVIILSPIFVSFALSIMLPSYFFIGAGQVFVTCLSSGVIWGMTYFSIRKTTFYQNLLITRIKVWQVYFAIYLSMMLVTFCSQVTFWLFTIIFDIIGFNSFAEMFLNLWGNLDVVWSKVDWITIIYSWILSILLMFIGSFSTRKIFKNSKSYFIVLFVYTIFLLPFGNIIRPEMSYSVNNQSMILHNEINFIYVVSIIIPQSHINNMLFAAMSSGVNHTDLNTGIIESWGQIEMFSSFHWSTDWKWNFTLLYPPIVCILLLEISYLIP